MVQPNLAEAPVFELPEGYRIRMYRDGDLAEWLRIQRTDRYFQPTAATFAETLPGDTADLAARVMFLVDPAGVDIGSVTAWRNSTVTDHEIGHIHWVAIVPQAQGRGLAKPMLSHAIERMRIFGYSEACLETNTIRVPALNLYLRFGFQPYPRNDNEYQAWRAVAPYLNLTLRFARGQRFPFPM